MKMVHGAFYLAMNNAYRYSDVIAPIFLMTG
jgi:hypothetical protein